MFRSPLNVMKHFSASGEQGLAATFLKPDKDLQSEGLESLFCVPVADYRDRESHDSKTKTLIDFMWSVWDGTFDDEIMELCAQDIKNSSASKFLWHRHLQESTTDMGIKYRAFLAACNKGPIAPDTQDMPGIVGASELSEDVKEDVQRTQKLLMKLRRDTVSFVKLPAAGGASGAEYTKAQMENMWDSMRLGHRFARKKDDVRAFVLSADLFPPNLVKHGASASLGDPIAADAEKMKRVVEFIIQKRLHNDLILLFDGRSRLCRKVMEQSEDKLTASGVHVVTECWIVFPVPTKKEDPRVPGRETSFASENKETLICALPQHRGTTRIVQRADFNSCGESSSTSTTYTGAPMRRLCELPRMSTDTKSSILGVAASGAVKGGPARLSVQNDIDENGHPFSHCEVKPLSLWQRICEHHHVTHIVDFAAGSGALAMAAAGAIEYEGVAANEVHGEWLDSTLDRVVMYLAGKDKQFAKKLGGDDDFMEKVGKYFGGR